MVTRIVAAAVAGTALLATGCAVVSPRSGGSPAGAMCEFALADAVMGDTRLTRAAAEASLATNIADARGFLTSQGYHRFHVVGRDVRCEPYQLFPGLHRCIATAQVCGRRR